MHAHGALKTMTGAKDGLSLRTSCCWTTSGQTLRPLRAHGYGQDAGKVQLHMASARLGEQAILRRTPPRELGQRWDLSARLMLLDHQRLPRAAEMNCMA